MPQPVIVYSQPGCPPCTTVKEFLKAQNVPFVVKDITEDPQALAEMSEMGSQSTPTIKVGARVMIGFRRAELAAWLAEE